MIKAVAVTKRFGDVLAVDSVNLDVPEGTVLGMIGPNGSGKTTLVRMMVGILKPTSGACFVGDKRADNLRAEDKASIGYMTQQRALYPDLTARENLEFFAEAYGIRDDDLKAKAIDRVIALTRIAEYLDRPVEVLSGGTVQRLSLACTIVHDPKIIFLDEPTVGVSPGLRLEFWDYFKKLAREGRTIIMTTHYLEEASRCDSVVMINRGRVIAHAPPDEIISGLPLSRTVMGEVSADNIPRLKQILGDIAALELTGNRFRVAVPNDTILLQIVNVLSTSDIGTRNVIVRQPGLEEAFAHLAGGDAQ